MTLRLLVVSLGWHVEHSLGWVANQEWLRPCAMCSFYNTRPEDLPLASLQYCAEFHLGNACWKLVLICTFCRNLSLDNSSSSGHYDVATLCTAPLSRALTYSARSAHQLGPSSHHRKCNHIRIHLVVLFHVTVSCRFWKLPFATYWKILCSNSSFLCQWCSGHRLLEREAYCRWWTSACLIMILTLSLLQSRVYIDLNDRAKTADRSQNCSCH